MKKRLIRKLAKSQQQTAPSEKPDEPEAETNLFPVVGIGASAGGLEAFTQFLHALPPQTGLALVYIQHLDPTHTSMLSELLARETKMPVHEAEEGLRVLPDHVYVIVPNTNLIISHGFLHLSPRAGQSGRFMPVDEFFYALATDLGPLAIGVILSGTASDGAAGIRSINKAGGITFAQSIESASQTGMPQSAIDTGAVDFVLDPHGIAEEVVRIARNPLIISSQPIAGDNVDKHEERFMEKIFLLLKKVHDLDFSHYKQSTIARRIGRRLVLLKISSIENYLGYLEQHPKEIDILAEDMLIHVTSFFRESEIFDVLKSEVFPHFFRDRHPGLPVRIWIPGCSTGEEAYSVLISLLESMEEQEVSYPIQIFASDISEPALTQAREGIYPESEIFMLTEKQRTQFFDKLNGDYRVKKTLRESCIFAYHDLTKDPPFSHLDFISCRNLLIYLDVPMQRMVIPIFHYCLNADGFLLLGLSETIGPFTTLFSTVNQKFRIYKKKPSTNRIPLPIPFSINSRVKQIPRREVSDFSSPRFDPAVEANRILRTFGPPSVFVNETLDILQFSGRIGPYLEPVQGAAGLTLNKMIHRDLLVDLHTAIRKARKTGKPVRKGGIGIMVEGQPQSVWFTVTPIHSSHMPDVWHYLIVIEDESQDPDDRVGGPPEPGSVSEGIDIQEIAGPKEYEKIQQELADTKGHLKDIIEEEREASEDLLSALHELQSQNEELQSINEELETAKEELQSSNEELATVNEELQTQLIEREKAENATRSSEKKYRTLVEHNPDVMIRYDRQYHLVYANPAIKYIAKIPPDKVIGRTPEELNFPQDRAKDWQDNIGKVFTTGKAVSSEIETGIGGTRRFFQWFFVPEFNAEMKVESVLSTSRDITRLKIAEEELRKKNAELNAANVRLASGEELRENLTALTRKSHELSDSLAEKEMLLSEIHHRVKNNLSAFISLLSLESTNETTPTEQNLRKDLQNRARSMALVHETLYQTKQYSRVDMGVYINTLIEQIAASYKSSKDIRTVVEAEGIFIDLPRATPCGLLINELITNSFKYAFPESFDCRNVRNEPCTIRINLVKENGNYTLHVGDNGIGLPEDIDISTTKSLGLKLVNFISKHQLRAKIDIIRGNGSEYVFQFPVNINLPGE